MHEGQWHGFHHGTRIHDVGGTESGVDDGARDNVQANDDVQTGDGFDNENGVEGQVVDPERRQHRHVGALQRRTDDRDQEPRGRLLASWRRRRLALTKAADGAVDGPRRNRNGV